MNPVSLQDQYAPKSICFGCGPANSRGLQIKSFLDDATNEITAQWTPEAFHDAFPGIINGGIIGTLLDCHCNWTAAWSIMKAQGLKSPLCTVTANYSISLLRPTPSGHPLHLTARLENLDGHKATIYGELLCNGKVCATCKGLFVAVKEGHPAYHRWEV